jgi:hypothetical protein
LKQQLLSQRATALEEDIETGDYEFNMPENCNGKAVSSFLTQTLHRFKLKFAFSNAMHRTSSSGLRVQVNRPTYERIFFCSCLF